MGDSFDLSRLYPSGFYGASYVEQTKPRNFVDDARAIIDKTYVPGYTKFTSSLEVAAMWNKIKMNDREFNKFDFKCSIIELALRHFGVNGFIDYPFQKFIDTQMLSPSLSSYHVEWLIETIRFILFNDKRTINFDSWSTLLVANNKQDIPVSKLNELKDLEKFYNNYSIRNMLVDWTKAPSGLNDIGESLFVLYGPR